VTVGQPEERLLEFVESDGEPMGETELHVLQIVYLLEALKLLARGRQADEGAHVGSNLNFYYDPEDARRRVCPDVFLTRGLADAARPRRTWKLWKDGPAPDLIVEVASQGTYEEDLGAKRELYREVFRTSEYLVFDPEGFMEQGPLRAWRLNGDGAYRRVGTSSRVESRVARASFEVIDGSLRVVDSQGIVPGGAAEGMREGMRAARGESIVQVLETRFGALPGPALVRLRARLDRLDDGGLQRALTRAVTAASVDAFVATLGP
jgi:Uma2 family endonuclease